MTYREALKYLDSFVNYEKASSYDYKASLKLERMRRFASLLGDPHKSTRGVHVAGSKGKGSTAVYIHSILRQAGFNAGLYTSPHLTTFRERIRIGDELIGEEDLSRILADIKDTITSHMKDEMPTFFEVYTAIAYLYFKEKNVDFAVYEVGLGGRLDATNIIEPLACALTPISYEHTDKLGYTLREIASEKCGIIKSGSTCVSAPQEREALQVIEDTCRARNSRLILIGRDIKFEEVRSSDEEEVFNVFGLFGGYPTLTSKLIGPHQMINASVAIGVAEALRLKGITIPADAIRDGIENARWEGRLEIINRRPLIVLDGAQNRESAKALVSAIKKIFKYKKLILVFGVSKDKDVRGVLEEMLPICDSIVLTKSNVLHRASEPAKIKEEILNMKHGIKDMILTYDTEEALARALSMANPEDLVLITGSLFIVGEVKEHYSGCVKTV
jgi:dihydrofolate synthase/folylpolyglutamate synthase